MAVKGVLFDSGGVLIGPRGGRWNPRYDFEEVLARHHPDIPAEAFPIDLYRRLDLDHFFRTVVISAVLGCRKPDPRMYRAGSDGLGLAPGDCLFVKVNARSRSA